MDMKDERLQQALDELIKTNYKLIDQQAMWRSFLHGMVSALGATVGVAIVLYFLVWLLHTVSNYNALAPVANTLLPLVDRTGRGGQYVTPSPSPSPKASPSPSPSPSSSPDGDDEATE